VVALAWAAAALAGCREAPEAPAAGPQTAPPAAGGQTAPQWAHAIGQHEGLAQELMAHGAPSVPVFLYLARSSDPTVRRETSHALRNLWRHWPAAGPERTELTEALRSLAEDASPETRLAAGQGLVMLLAPSSPRCPALSALLSSAEAEVETQLLAFVASAAELPAWVLDEVEARVGGSPGSPEVRAQRSAALLAHGRTGPAVLDAAREVLGSERRLDRLAVLQALAVSPASATALQRELSDTVVDRTETRERVLALLALSEVVPMAPGVAVPEPASHEDEEVLLAAAFLHVRQGGPGPDGPALDSAMATGRPAVRLRAAVLALLVGHETESAQRVLRAAAASDHFRAETAHALARLGSRGVSMRPEVEALAASDPFWDVAQAARRTLARWD
jgi:hypothetical protein